MGVLKEALNLNSLEDFNTTEADLMELKDDIFTAWKSRDKCKTSSLRPTFIPSSVRASEKKKSTLCDNFSPSSATGLAPLCLEHFLWLQVCHRRNSVTPHKACGSTTRDPISLNVCALWAGCLPHSKLLFLGIHPRIQL